MIYKLINRGLTGDATKIRLPANFTPQQLIHSSALQTHGSRPFNPPVITDEASPFALRSTRNRPRTAVRQGASWTAAYHLQLTVAAVARPVRSSVRALGVLAAERSWLLLAQTASARRSVQPVSRAQASSPWSTLPAGTPRRRSPVSSMRCPPIRFRRPGSGCPAVRCPVTWGRRPEGPALGRLLSTRPAVCCPPVRCPAVWCLPPSVRTRPSPPMLRRWRWGPRSSWPADPDHRNGWRPRWLPGRRRLDRRSRRPGRGRRCRRRVGQWEVGGGPGPPGWVRAAAAALDH